jgi:hypothetical protein
MYIYRWHRSKGFHKTINKIKIDTLSCSTNEVISLSMSVFYGAYGLWTR